MRKIEELQISESYPKIDEVQINILEDQVGFKLPQTFIAFIKQANGGHPKLDTFSNEEGEWDVNNFFFLGPDDGTTESIIWNYQHKWPGAPKGLLPFAADGGGNLFCLDVTGGEPAPVIFWSHDTTGADVYRLANSFEEFIDRLHENPDYI